MKPTDSLTISPSKLERAVLCPGSVRATAGLPWVDSTHARRGRALHDAMALLFQAGDKALDKIKASGKSTVYTPTAAESNEWKKALMPVHKEMESRVGKATIEMVYKAAGFVAPK